VETFGWQWVERHVDFRMDVMHEVIGEVAADVAAQARKELALIKDELALTRRELEQIPMDFTHSPRA
jgi:hypothetical protein